MVSVSTSRANTTAVAGNLFTTAGAQTSGVELGPIYDIIFTLSMICEFPKFMILTASMIRNADISAIDSDIASAKIKTKIGDCHVLDRQAAT